MNCRKWLSQYENGLAGKTVVLFGATGGIGKELSRYILTLGGNLITVDRNREKAQQLTAELKNEFSKAEITNLFADLSDFLSVQAVTQKLKQLEIDIVVHNAGAYSVPRFTTSLGFDNVFQINFVAPYYITTELLPMLSQRKGRVVAVGSIAHNYSKMDPADWDFATRRQASLVYGNAKRHWMYTLLELSKEHPEVAFSVAHPGISFTGITNHYPKLIFAVIKHPMKVIFMKPKAAALSIVMGMFENTEPYSWIGPQLFNVWGRPCKQALRTASQTEIAKIFQNAKAIALRWAQEQK